LKQLAIFAMMPPFLLRLSAAGSRRSAGRRAASRDSEYMVYQPRFGVNTNINKMGIVA
jgi:hypothetical protein